jgi:hypothetical protein
MAAPVAPERPGQPLGVAPPRLLAPAVSRDPFSNVVTPYDPAPDGQRFLLNGENRAAAPPLTLLAPWRHAVPHTAR